jgi:hypothetical protein
MGWQVWLASPLLVTLAAAVSIWWRSRPRPTPSVHARVREHNRFLEGLSRHGGGQPQLPESVLLVGPAAASAGASDPSDATDEPDRPADGPRDGRADEPEAAQAAPLS